MSDANTASPSTAASSNDNVMAAVATIPLVGLIMYFAMKDASDLVKFYAKQSIGLLLLSIIISVFSFAIAFLPLEIYLMISCASSLLSLVVFILWIVLLINALQGKKFRIPVMSDMMDQILK
jgi:uncharacterized membrane protein